MSLIGEDAENNIAVIFEPRVQSGSYAALNGRELARGTARIICAGKEANIIAAGSDRIGGVASS